MNNPAKPGTSQSKRNIILGKTHLTWGTHHVATHRLGDVLWRAGVVLAFVLATATSTLIDLVQDTNMMKKALVEILKERQAMLESDKAGEKETA